MHSFATTITVATALLSASLTAAIPHARKHYHLHPTRSELEPRVEKLAPLAGRAVPGTFNLSPIGQCGGSSGFGCADGFCCSKWGYCGTTAEYCGAGGSSSNDTGLAGGLPGGSYPPSQSGAPAPSGWGWGPPGSSAAPAPSGGAPAPSSYAPAPSGGASSAPASAPSAPASAPPAPSSAAPAPSSAPAAPSSAAGGASSAPAYSAPAPSASSGGGSSGGFSGYKMYTGDGAASAGWPSMDQWMDFESAFSASTPNMKASCAQWNQDNDSDQEISDIKSAITSTASASGIDERFILAIIMQESNGCVRVQTTDNGVVNPGLMQSHNGAGTCWNNGVGVNPCPAKEINLMVQDGVEGTSSGDGLKQTFAQCPTSGSQAYYQAAVIYNSGNLPSNLDDNTATPCYASDVANRLMGWTQGTSGCTLS